MDIKQIKNYVKEHQGEILIGTMCIGSAIVGVKMYKSYDLKKTDRLFKKYTDFHAFRYCKIAELGQIGEEVIEMVGDLTKNDVVLISVTHEKK